MARNVDKFTVHDKETGYIYRWCNTDERSMLIRKEQGYEVCRYDEPELPSEISKDAIPAPGGVTRRRGTDLILCRIKQEVWDENVGSVIEENRQRHAGVIDTMIAQAKENAERGIRDAGLKIDRPLVFKDTAESFKQ